MTKGLRWTLAVLALAAFSFLGGVAGAQYNAKVYIEQGAQKLVVASGGEIEVQSGATLDVQSGATTTLNLSAGDIGTADLATGAVTGIKLAAGIFDMYSVTGQDETGDATYDVTGVASGDEVAFVLRLNTAADVATVTLLAAADFTVTGANVITRSSNPENNANDQLLFLIIDKS